MPVTKSQLVNANNVTHQFISLRGPMRLLGTMVQDITRPGVNGHAFRNIGKRGQPFQMTGIVDRADFAAVSTYELSLRDSRGQLCTIYDDYAIQTGAVMLLDVVRITVRPALSHVGGVDGVATGQPVALAYFGLTLLHTFVPS